MVIPVTWSTTAREALRVIHSIAKKTSPAKPVTGSCVRRDTNAVQRSTIRADALPVPGTAMPETVDISSAEFVRLSPILPLASVARHGPRRSCSDHRRTLVKVMSAIELCRVLGHYIS